MLQTAVHPLQKLPTAALLKVQAKKDLDYDVYSSLLLSTASDYDSKHGVNKGKRQIYAHEIVHEDDDLFDASYEMDPFDIDTPVDTIQSYASKFTPRPGMKEKVPMPKDKWFALDQKTKGLWDQIDEKYKSIILVILNCLVHLHSLVKHLANHISLLNIIAISTFMRCLHINSYKFTLMN
jgi:hypothetical protein